MSGSPLETTVRPIGVLVVDDQNVYCQLARDILRKDSQFSVVGEAYDGQQALDVVEELRPDVILMDVEMPGMNGLEATYLIRNKHPEVRVVLVSAYDEREYGRLASRVGAIAFIPKKDLSGAALAQVLDREPDAPDP